MAPLKLTISLALAVVAAGFAAPSLGDTREKQQENFELFSRHAGPPIEEIRQFRFFRWQQLGDGAIGVWSNPGELYLIEVDRPCNGLDWAKSVGVTSTHRVVMAKFDFVTFERQRCHITRIRPVDEKAMKAEQWGNAAADAER